MAVMTDTSTSAQQALPADRLSGLIDFLQKAEGLKDTLRSGSTQKGRRESTAEHSWRLALMIILFENHLSGVDSLKLLKLCIVHDLGEVISGDVPAPEQTPGDNRAARERIDFISLCDPLPDDIATQMLALWDEYAAASTPEARLAKAFDKLETILQHHLMPPRSVVFHDFNLSYGRKHTDHHPITRQIRDVLDKKTQEILKELRREPAS